MISRYCLAGTIAVVVFASSTAAAASGTTPSPDARCQHVTAEKPVTFHGRTLVETPDITDPELRLANALLSHRCRAEAILLVEKYNTVHPDDYRTRFLAARLAWTGGDSIRAEQIVWATLREHPDFASAQLLKASLFIEQERPDEARPLLDSLSLHSPTDLWVYLDGLRLEALSAPSQALRQTLLEITKNPGFPPSARETASQTGRQLPNISRDQFEAFYWADLDYESATPMACKIHNLAFLLSEDGGRFAQARALLESPKAQNADCLGAERNRVLLAQAYLMEAARISAGPTAANAALVSKAHEILGGDWSELARHVIGRPQFAALQPFLASATAPSSLDRYGRTQICNAVMLLDVAAVQAQLDLGADPNGRCEDDSLIDHLVMTASERSAGAGQTIVRLLRGAGARVTPRDIEWCRNPDNGRACAQLLLPLLAP